MRERVGLKAQTTGFATNLSDAGIAPCVAPLKFPAKAQRGKGDLPSLHVCAFAGKNSEVQFQPELELPRVEGGRWAAVVPAVARALVERPHIVDKR